MNLFPVLQRESPDEPELMDRPESDPTLVRDALKSLRCINKWFGGLRAIRTSLFPMLARFPRDREITILDVATGSGDHPRALVHLARKHRIRIRIIAIDRHPVMVEHAGALSSEFPEISVVRGDALSLPFAAESLDFVICSSVLHHFEASDAERLVQDMARIARRAVIIHDLTRSRRGAFLAWLYSRLTTRNPITRSDAVHSVLRAFTPGELAKLTSAAGYPLFEIRRRALFRMVLTIDLEALQR